MHLVAKSSETGEIRWQTLQSVAGGAQLFVAVGSLFAGDFAANLLIAT